MAIDTAAKRRSAVGVRRLPWLRRFTLPLPDASMTIGDRQQTAYVYLGITPSAGFTVTVVNSGTSYVFVQSVKTSYVQVRSSLASYVQVQSSKVSRVQTYK